MIGKDTKIYHPQLSNIHEDAEIGSNCVIHSHVWIGTGVKVGNRVKIQAFTFIPDGVTIEDNVFIAPNVIFTNDPKLEVKGRDFWKPTFVKRGAKIGAGAIIIAGVTIGENAVVGAGAVINKDVPASEIWAGVPAKFLKKVS